MKAFTAPTETVRRPGLILLCAEKCPNFGADEHSQTGILTWGFKPRSRLPGFIPWLWESVAHQSGATDSQSHGL